MNESLGKKGSRDRLWHELSLSLSLFLSFSISLSFSHPLCLSNSLYLFVSLCLSLSLSLSLPLCLSLILYTFSYLYWLNYWHTLISNDTSGFTSNTLLIRFPIMLSVYIVYRMHKVIVVYGCANGKRTSRPSNDLLIGCANAHQDQVVCFNQVFTQAYKVKWDPPSTRQWPSTLNITVMRRMVHSFL